MCQARGQGGPSWLRAQLAEDQGPGCKADSEWVILEMFWGAKGLDGTTCGGGGPCGFWPKVAPPEQVRGPGAAAV